MTILTNKDPNSSKEYVDDLSRRLRSVAYNPFTEDGETIREGIDVLRFLRQLLTASELEADLLNRKNKKLRTRAWIFAVVAGIASAMSIAQWLS